MKLQKICYIIVTKEQKILNILVNIGNPKKNFDLKKINYPKNIILNL